jgi:hypothetical protein
MPQKKKPIRKPRKKNLPKQHIGIYIFAAVVLFFIIYWISKPPSQTQLTDFAKKVTDKADSIISPKVSDLSNKQKKQDTAKDKKPETAVEYGIYSALEKLSISDKDIKKKKKDGEIFFNIPIDPNLTDLTFSNMIFKGEAEANNGRFVSGKEIGRRQILVLVDNETKQKYNIELYYKRSEESSLPKGRILSIIVDDFGNYKGKLLEGFAKSNPAVCFAIMPQTPYATEAMEIAKKYGHESIIHIPMEPINYPRENPGDHALFIQHSASEINRRVERFINQLPDCIGVNNHMGSLATSDEATMTALMHTIKKHNLIFIDSRTTNTSVAYQIAQRNQIKALKRDVFLDEPDISNATLDKKIEDCIALSQTKNYVVTIMHCHTAKHLDYLNQFIAKAKANGFDIVPITTLSSYKLPEIR